MHVISTNMSRDESEYGIGVSFAIIFACFLIFSIIPLLITNLLRNKLWCTICPLSEVNRRKMVYIPTLILILSVVFIFYSKQGGRLFRDIGIGLGMSSLITLGALSLFYYPDGSLSRNIGASSTQQLTSNNQCRMIPTLSQNISSNTCHCPNCLAFHLQNDNPPEYSTVIKIDSGIKELDPMDLPNYDQALGI